jgi:exosome complex component CSL4
VSFVIPGEVICVEEEALPSGYVYSDGRGYLRSHVIGVAVLNKYKKTASVRPLVKRGLTLKQGVIVEGLISSVYEDIAVVKIYQADNIKINATGLLHISQISSEYVTDIQDYIRPSDTIKARVLNNMPPYLLTIKEPQLGVIHAYCSSCGEELYLTSTGVLTCNNCGRIEKRKVAVGGYLLVVS